MWSNEDITAPSHDLFEQAKMAAHDYMLDAIRSIDKHFGEGSARKHPELIGAYMQTCAIDLGTTIIAQQIRRGLNYIAEQIPDRSDT